MERITVDLISNKVFTEENRGYSRKEVDEFLDDICDEMERMEAEIKDLRQRNTVTPVPAAAAAPAMDDGKFREILEMAVKLKDDTLAKAREDAEAIRAKAEAEATERLDGLHEERDRLEREVEGLKKVAADYRANFESLLQAQQEALEKVSELF